MGTWAGLETLVGVAGTEPGPSEPETELFIEFGALFASLALELAPSGLDGDTESTEPFPSSSSSS